MELKYTEICQIGEMCIRDRFTAYELLEKRPNLSIAVFEMGNELTKRHCPIDGDKVKSCIHCKNCSIMSGFGGAGAFSDGKYRCV